MFVHIFRLLRSIHSFYIHFFYFIFVSIIGFVLLKVTSSFGGPSDLDLFFTSVSATTVSSMLTVNMEVFSNSQLIIMTILMLVGGEVFLSLIKLQYSKYARLAIKKEKNVTDSGLSNPVNAVNVPVADSGLNNSDLNSGNDIVNVVSVPVADCGLHSADLEHVLEKSEEEESKYMNDSINFLWYTVLGYFIIVHVMCSVCTILYFDFVPDAKQVLKEKGIKIPTYSIFLAVSSFANCGFIPTNENLTIFNKNPGLFLILIPQVLIGNTLFPSCLLLVIFCLKYITKRPQVSYILKNYNKVRYEYLMSKRKCCSLAATVFGLILIVFIVFVSLEWNNSANMDGLDIYQKTVVSLFQVINTRYAGEAAFDFTALSSAVLVSFVAMMYLPPYTFFSPVKDGEKSSVTDEKKCRGKKKSWVQNVTLSQLAYVAIFVIIICITERKKMTEDPLNLSVINIIFEVVSAYGNVGLSVGYNCQKRIKTDGECKDVYCGNVGKWSKTGKVILIVVMFFGKLKKFHTGGGKAWKFS